MKVCHISDTHMYHLDLDIPECDMIIHSGDIDAYTLKDFTKFLVWYGNLKIKYKIFVPGNHDFFCEKFSDVSRQLCKEYNVIYLENDYIEIEGLKIYGSPYVPQYGRWAFMRQRGSELSEIWDKIPDGLDILITHGPPKGIMDTGRGNESAGCYDLLAKVIETNPKYHLFGHMHMCRGIEEHFGIIFINSAMVDDGYNEIRIPTLFDTTLPKHKW